MADRETRQKMKELEQRYIEAIGDIGKTDRERVFEATLKEIAEGKGKYAKKAQEALDDA